MVILIYNRAFNSHKISGIFTLILIFLFIQIAGNSPSALRAFFMLLFLLFSKFLGRSTDTENAFISVAFISLCFNPLLLEARGFLFSYSAVAAILFYSLPLETFIRKIWRPFALIPRNHLNAFQRFVLLFKREFLGLICIAFSAFLATACLTVSSFGIFTGISLISNVIVIPIISIVLVLAFFSIIFYQIPILGNLSDFVWFLNCKIVYFIEIFTTILTEIPLHFSTKNVPEWFGPAGTLLILSSFFLGNYLNFFRDRPLFRLSFPPLLLLAFFLVFL